MKIHIPWSILALAALVAAVAVAAVLELGAPASSARTSRELVTATDGVVQSTVTGTGNVEPATDLDVNFQASGVLQSLDVSVGQRVDKGQLLATLDPTAAQLTVDQAEQSLTSANDQLANAENEQSAASSSSSSTTTSPTAADVASSSQFVSDAIDAPTPTSTSASSSTTTTASTSTSTTTSSSSTTTTSGPGKPGRSGATGSTGAGGTARSGASDRSGASGSSGTSGASRAGSAATNGTSGTSGTSGANGGTAQSADSLAAGVASAQAAVDGAEATLRDAQNALSQTRLFAPASGTVVSVADVSSGDAVSANGSGSSTGSGSGASSDSGDSGSGATGSSSSAASSSSSSGLVEIASTHELTMTVAFSESDISEIHVGQPATITLDALTGVELPGRVTAISPLGSSSSGVVSYDATLTLKGSNPRVKPGMSASASVVTAQASGVNLPSSAVSGTSGSVAHVEVMNGGNEVSTAVVVGLVGDTRTQIVSGLRAGQQVVVTETLPSLSAPAATTSSPFGSGGGGFSGGGLGGGGGGGIRRIFGGGLGGG